MADAKFPNFLMESTFSNLAGLTFLKTDFDKYCRQETLGVVSFATHQDSSFL